MIQIEILAVVLLTLVNGALSMSELALISSRRSRLEGMAEEGSRGARRALDLMEDSSRFLSTVQIGITLVGIFAGAFGGATLGLRLGKWLDTFAWIAPYGEALGLTVTVVAITYLSLVFGELLPKRIAMTHPERIAAVVAVPLWWLSVAAAPAVWALRVSTEAALKLMGLSGDRDETVTEEEIKSMIAEGTRGGIFVPQEQEMIEGVLRLADRPVRVIMTPRSEIGWLDVTAGREEILDALERHKHSRMLVCEGTVDHPVGFVHTKNLLPGALRGGEIDVGPLMAPLFCVPDRAPVLRVLNHFRDEKAHIALVVNEYGATEGVVTLTDVIEAVTGELPEHGEEEGPRIVRREDGSWLIDAYVPTDEVAFVTGVDMGEEVQSLAGFILERLGRIPEVGVSFRHENARFEIVDMDHKRIDKVLIVVEGNGTEKQSAGGEEKD